MPKVLCTAPNASEEIDGHKFEQHANGMLSEDLSDEVAARFATIPGYVIVGNETEPAKPDGAAAEAAKAALLARAEAAGLKVKQTWGVERLAAEVEKAEAEAKAAAEAADKAES